LNPRTLVRTATVGVSSDYFGGDDKFNIQKLTQGCNDGNTEITTGHIKVSRRNTWDPSKCCDSGSLELQELHSENRQQQLHCKSAKHFLKNNRSEISKQDYNVNYTK
jgi:hypothetical protein